MSDNNSETTTVSMPLICISIGYFIYDLLLSLTNLQYPGRIEIIVHHLISLWCLNVCLLEKRFISYSLIAMTVEISSVFIHIREMLLLANVTNNQTAIVYKTNSLITVFTLIVFRFTPLTWISYQLYRECHQIEISYLIMAVLFVLTIYLVTVVVFYRVIAADFNVCLLKTISINLMIANVVNKVHYQYTEKLGKLFK
ncbi:TLC domain-containing protein 2-like [Oppia nitens]|uniref:TLC domain-containing protein 2-like n=1 Tax=Oppia nitens TaxID=1686743 RepID=UPI0023DAEA90|nr:TLC domain-containing protein 2-like [Oppia nitens]